jgi:hypothetical protein
MGIIHRAGVESALPQVPFPLPILIGVLGVSRMHGVEHPGKRGIGRRHGNEVNMIAHQAEGQHWHRVFL